jgi:hypothetical protein
MKVFKVWVEFEKTIKAESKKKAEQIFKKNLVLKDIEVNSWEIKK